jgi:hypothetical protein
MNRELLCKDCEHVILPSWPERLIYGVRFAQCKKDYVEGRFDPVTGKSTPGYHASASVVRVDTRICGPDAHAWQPRTKNDLFKYLKHVR